MWGNERDKWIIGTQAATLMSELVPRGDSRRATLEGNTEQQQQQQQQLDQHVHQQRSLAACHGLNVKMRSKDETVTKTDVFSRRLFTHVGRRYRSSVCL